LTETYHLGVLETTVLVRDERRTRFDQPGARNDPGLDADLPISRPVVLCSPSANQVAPGSGILRSRPDGLTLRTAASARTSMSSWAHHTAIEGWL
jgi:hypothetical protein